jgi:two-component sensor histidine kinase
MKDLLVENLNPKTLFTWPVFVLTLSWSISIVLLDRVFNPPGFFVERVASVSLAHVGMFVAFFFGIKLLNLLPRLFQSLLMIPIIVVATIVRGLIVFYLMTEFGLIGPEQFNYRVFGAVANLGIPLTMSAVAVHRIRTYSSARRQLLAENNRLLELRKMAGEQIRETAQLRLEEIRATVAASLSRGGSNTPDATMRAITETVEDVVRPLISQIESEAAKVVPESDYPERIRIDWPEALRGALASRYFSPLPVGLTLFVAAFIFVTTYHTFWQSVYLLSTIGLGSWLFLHLLKKLLARLENKLPGAIVGSIALLGLFISGSALGAASLVVTTQTEEPLSVIFLGPFYLPAVSILLALARSTQAQAREANQRLADVTGELAWEVTRVNDEQRQMRRAIASLLHGPLQSGLTSSLLRLELASEKGSEVLEQAEKAVRQELASLIESVKLGNQSESMSVSDVIAEINATWLGIATANSSLVGVTPEELEKDTVLMTTLAELYAELSFNSIKHGKATQIDFVLDKTSEDIVCLTCTDNGNQAPDSGRIGLGTKLLDECALRWKRQPMQEGIGTTTEVMLPYSPIERAKA